MPNPISIFDCIPHVINCIPRTWTFTVELQEVKTKHKELTASRGQLNTLKESVISRVANAEKQGQVCIPNVDVWLQNVKINEVGLNEVLTEGSQLLNRSSYCALIPCGCWNSQMFLSKVKSQITVVTDLINRGNFEGVSQTPPPPSVEPQPENPNVGLESVFKDAWSFIEKETAGIMGLYGNAGVGKTTLMKKINNNFLNVSHGFDVVIWVVISKDVNLRGIQNQIGKRLALSWSDSESPISCAHDIYNRMRSKRFVVLLDDICEQLDLSSIGIPNPKDPSSASNSKVVFTTRSEEVCSQMDADMKIVVKCLKWVEAWELFQDKVGQKTFLDSDPQIRMVAESIAKECDGLPSLLIFHGRAMESKKTIGEWNSAFTALTTAKSVEVLSQPAPPASIEMQPEDPIVGLDSIFEDAWSFIKEDVAGIMGLHGMGGVGKTTLLKKMNNKFLNDSHGFDVVIWVVISNDVNLRGIQNQIGKSLGIFWRESENITSCAHDIFNRLRSKKFVILLDDIWEELELSRIGIPHPKDPNSVNKSKIVFTTRSEIVCGQMEADKKIMVECLKWNKAWELFQNKVGQQNLLISNPEIRQLAKSITKECDGLPLALIVTGRTMSSKKTVGEWNDAVTTLRNNAVEFAGMEDKVFSILKFSYDRLPNDSVRSCFLFCSLYPEDYHISIKSLVQKWIGEGYIEFDVWQEAIDKGDGIIGILRNTCLLEYFEKSLLEDNTVKMHDVIRDLAQWISCDCGRDKKKMILVVTGNHVKEAPKADKWAGAHSISLMNTGITRIQNIPNCQNLSTFICTPTPKSIYLPENFFLSMPTLRFLDLSAHPLSASTMVLLPKSIGDLGSLEYLDLSCMILGKLPVQMKKLVSLKYLFVGGNNKVPLGVIKNLLSLRTLKVSLDSFGDGKEKDDDRIAGIQELECLTELTCLDIRIPFLKDLDTFVSKSSLVRATWSLSITYYSENAQNSRLSGKPLVIDDFQSLNKMFLTNIPQLVVSWDSNTPHLTNLRHIEIIGCESMVSLNWLCLAPHLRGLKISFCSGIKGIFLEDDSFTPDENTFSSLNLIFLENLPRLESIYPYALALYSLKEVVVYRCPQLRRLPLDSNSSKNTLQYIQGRLDWWNNLVWDNESVKSTFTSFYRDPLASQV